MIPTQRGDRTETLTIKRSERPLIQVVPDADGAWASDPAAKSTNPGIRAWWGIGALLAVILLVAAAIALWNQRSSTSSTATGPSTTQSAPNSTGQGGAAR
jgi:hypothetical protein